MLDYKLLEALAAVTDEGGFEKASEILHISQSAISQRIRLLEDQLGSILLIRAVPPRPTEAGTKLLSHFRQVCLLEQELKRSLQPDYSDFSRFPVGINADSLATWFFPAIKNCLLKEKILIDLHVNDQDQTFKLLKSGQVFGCISTKKKTAQGCTARALGSMRYGLFCNPHFFEKWFRHGIDEACFLKAPITRFNRDDQLNEMMLKSIFGSSPGKLRELFVPSSEAYLEVLLTGIACGVLPYIQCQEYINSGEIIDCAPDSRLDVHLYWHCWNINSSLLESFSSHLINNSRQILR